MDFRQHVLTYNYVMEVGGGRWEVGGWRLESSRCRVSFVTVMPCNDPTRQFDVQPSATPSKIFVLTCLCDVFTLSLLLRMQKQDELMAVARVPVVRSPSLRGSTSRR